MIVVEILKASVQRKIWYSSDRSLSFLASGVGGADIEPPPTSYRLRRSVRPLSN